jgi:hypothetical protein
MSIGKLNKNTYLPLYFQSVLSFGKHRLVTLHDTSFVIVGSKSDESHEMFKKYIIKCYLLHLPMGVDNYGL